MKFVPQESTPLHLPDLSIDRAQEQHRGLILGQETALADPLRDLLSCLDQKISKVEAADQPTLGFDYPSPPMIEPMHSEFRCVGESGMNIPDSLPHIATCHRKNW